jgi:hypothetical protein
LIMIILSGYIDKRMLTDLVSSMKPKNHWMSATGISW